MGFFDFDLLVAMEHEYDDYLMECVDTNTLPLSFNEWWKSLGD